MSNNADCSTIRLAKVKLVGLDDIIAAPEDLCMAYQIMKNANVLPPELKLRKEVSRLQDLSKYAEEDGERKALAK